MPDPNAISDLVDVQILLDTQAVGAASFGVPMVMSTFTTPGGWVGVTRAKSYSGSFADVYASLIADGFAASSTTVAQVTALYAQSPPPFEVVVGRRDAGDADITAALDAIRAENTDWYSFAHDSRIAGDILLAFAWAQPRFVFYSGVTKDAAVLTDVGDHVLKQAWSSGYTRGHLLWHDAETASGYGPATSDTPSSETWALYNGAVLTATVDGGTPEDIAFAAAAATKTAGSAEPYAVNIGETYILEVNNGGSVTVTLTADDITDGAATAAQLAAVFNQVPGLIGSVSGSDELVITTLRQGSGAEIDITGGTAVAGSGLSVETLTGSGDAADISAMTAAELQTKLDGITGASASTIGLRVRVESDTNGLTSSLEFEGDANDVLNLPASSGTGVQEDHIDCALLGDLFTTDFDQQSVTLDNRTFVGIQPDALTGTQRGNVRKYNGSTYERRAGRAEIHFGKTPGGIYVDERIIADLADARLTEGIKSAQNSAANSKTKIPYTDAGFAVFENVIRGVLARLEAAGWIIYDPTEIVGSNDTGVTVPTAASQSAANRTARHVTGFKFRQQLQGAAHTVAIVGTLTSL